MNRDRRYQFSTLVSLFVVAVSGCGETPKSGPSQTLDQPVAVIDMTPPAGWQKTETRPLPTDDHGMTVAYEHESNQIAVTLYQYTRGHQAIPNDLTAKIVIEEFKTSKNGIESMAKAGGPWKSAREESTGTVTLGDSFQPALWTRYELTTDDGTVLSEIYLWSHANAFLKLRCTRRSGDADSYETILMPLLTALGNASNPSDRLAR